MGGRCRGDRRKRGETGEGGRRHRGRQMEERQGERWRLAGQETEERWRRQARDEETGETGSGRETGDGGEAVQLKLTEVTQLK